MSVRALRQGQTTGAWEASSTEGRGANALWMAFAGGLAAHPDAPVLLEACDQGGFEVWSHARLGALAGRMACALRAQGTSRGDFLPVCAPNSPSVVALLLAAAHEGFALVMLNVRLSEAERSLRLNSLAAALGHELSPVLDEDGLCDLAAGAAEAPEIAREQAGRNCSSEGAPGSLPAVVMFTSGTSGTPKAVPLTWDNLCGSARAANDRLGAGPDTLWQATLPLFHVGGLQMVVRSLLAHRPCALYRRFDAERVLADAAELSATHISVVNKTLLDLLDADDARAASGLTRVLGGYRCLLLGGAAPNQATLKRAARMGVPVFASFGMTETSSLIACARVGEDFEGWLELLPGYGAALAGEEGVEACVPSAESNDACLCEGSCAHQGQLAVQGPGVTSGYLNAPTPHTSSGMLLTGDTAQACSLGLRVKERCGDMFVSGGENVYPAEIEGALRELPGVRDAYVFGAPHEVWGRRPVAFIEAPSAAGACASLRGAHALLAGSGRLSRLNTPERTYGLDSLPRMGIGKIDRAVLRELDERRIEIRRIELFLIDQSLRAPIATAKTTLRSRKSLIVRATDAQGRRGLGECVAFDTPWYMPEVLSADIDLLVHHLAPSVLGMPFLSPAEVAPALFEACPQAWDYPMALGALEPALWDVAAQMLGVPLWSLVRDCALRGGGKEAWLPTKSTGPCSSSPSGAIGGFGALGELFSCREGVDSSLSASTLAGAVVGLGSVEDTVDAVRRCVDEGYRRVKLKVTPADVARIKAVRQAFPQLMLTLDANQSFKASDIDALLALDEVGAACIEEPLAPLGSHACPETTEELWYRLDELQGRMATPLCLDESFTCSAQARHVLRSYPRLRCFALKIGKFGGVGPALDFWREAHELGAQVWMGGMFDTSISKRLHAAFQALPGMNIPGDICASERYFVRDIASPAFSVASGSVLLNAPGHESGLGCVLSEEALAPLVKRRWTFDA